MHRKPPTREQLGRPAMPTALSRRWRPPPDGRGARIAGRPRRRGELRPRGGAPADGRAALGRGHPRGRHRRQRAALANPATLVTPTVSAPGPSSSLASIEEDIMTTNLNHPVVSRQQWLAERKALLAREKELTHLGDQIARERRAL